MKIYKNAAELVGNTPLVSFEKYVQTEKLGAGIFAKLEYLNPAGSAKDRVGKEMLDCALREEKSQTNPLSLSRQAAIRVSESPLMPLSSE